MSTKTNDRYVRPMRDTERPPLDGKRVTLDEIMKGTSKPKKKPRKAA